MKRQRTRYSLEEIEEYFSNEDIATFIKGFNTYENKDGKMVFHLPTNKNCDGSSIKMAVLRIVRKYKSLILLEKENRDRYFAKKEMDTYREVVVKANSREGLAGISSYKLEKTKSTFQFPIILLLKKFSIHPKVFKNTYLKLYDYLINKVRGIEVKKHMRLLRQNIWHSSYSATLQQLNISEQVMHTY